MKIKIFSGKDIKDMESAVNEFIADKVIHDIKYSSVFVAEQYNGNGIPIRASFYDRVMVMYDKSYIRYFCDC